jgi:glycogen operon protein
MVKTLHNAGIEVILDVVYNHTAEGNHLGPTLSFRGIDNAAYYRLVQGEQRYYMDYTGTGNTLNMQHPRTIQLIMDSLRYWVLEMHVDGFRFDLHRAGPGSAVNRLGVLRRHSPGPHLSRVKRSPALDAGRRFCRQPNLQVMERQYRDAIRRFWRGDDGMIPELAYRLTGSSDLYGASGRSPYASINFVTCHDGFTLRDLVSYEHKHNEANREDNHDGHNENLSRNWGAEGPTDVTDIVAMRARMQRNFLATLIFSQGVPMLSHGDELGRTQGGNNNAYCHDSEMTWVDWGPMPSRRTAAVHRRLVAISIQSGAAPS